MQDLRTETNVARITTKPPKPRRDECKRRNKGKCKCRGIYCDKEFWNKDLREIRRIEVEQGHWEDLNNNTAVGNYLPNEQDLTCGSHTKHGFIVGGEDSKIGEFPFVAALGIKVNFLE